MFQMKFLIHLGIIALYGGRNDYLFDKNKTSHIYNDICILKTSNFHWIEVKVCEGLPDCRSFFAMECLSFQKIYH